MARYIVNVGVHRTASHFCLEDVTHERQGRGGRLEKDGGRDRQWKGRGGINKQGNGKGDR